MSAGVADDPTSAVHVEDDRKWAFTADGFDDAYPHITHFGGHRDPLLLRGTAGSRTGFAITAFPGRQAIPCFRPFSVGAHW